MIRAKTSNKVRRLGKLLLEMIKLRMFESMVGIGHFCVGLAGHFCVGLARTIYIRCIYDIFGREITKYTVIYGAYIRFWPTLLLCL